MAVIGLSGMFSGSSKTVAALKSRAEIKKTLRLFGRYLTPAKR
jgi:hypothetical protein